jgi:hypothetical protein
MLGALHVPCQASISNEIVSVTYTAAAEAEGIFDNFEWPAGTAQVAPERCDDFDTCTKLQTNAACCVAPSTCCGSYSFQEDDGVTFK